MKNKVLLVLFALTFNAYSHEVFTDHAWQTASSGVIISLRNKLLDDPCKVTFKVTNLKTNLSVSKDEKSGPNDWNKITFPDDFYKCDGIYEMFKNEPNPFKWEAFVEGRLVLSGKFTYPHDEIIWTTHE